jgi:hypothetical protein
MSLDFSIIPVISDFVSAAYDIQTKIKNNVELEINITIDTQYSSSLSTRINRWKKLSHNIITIDQDYNESNSIIVLFSDKGSRAQVMEVDEFIDLLVSFEDDDEHKEENTDKTNTTESKTSDDNQEGGCILM